ncbi:hypothetical protein PPL_09093 [Heterostelium album PN500]|uniref:Arf3-interacting protein 1 N-terminal domain-containing protein n=1 Tax=Heterostelium pallidum (strain ATCC 26659 / Pp 5 / PN500) TaxID=670386 RepID=D3BKL1_HETP5|nr:hypothetical protein PPL_09093 [Heterostelium album PN500]EFA78441.1 hypothetical protein PPL_09093 [Heterostelium album PN500]|eukprot:XP_020430566.1 hypothetical protein PPL_09093 [Heterostelium album PN500]
MSDSPNRKPVGSPGLVSSFGSPSSASSTSSMNSSTSFNLNGNGSSNSPHHHHQKQPSYGGGSSANTVNTNSSSNNTIIKSVSASTGLNKSSSGVKTTGSGTSPASVSSPSLSTTYGNNNNNNSSTTSTTTSTSTTTTTVVGSSSSSTNFYSKKNVEYILLAEFDIDIGSKVKYQYPCPTGEDEALLAEFMLPDGAHNRDADWTVFFLNRPDPDGILSKNKKAKPKPKTQGKIICTIEAFIYKFSEEQESKGWVMLDADKLTLQIYSGSINVVGKNNVLVTKIIYINNIVVVVVVIESNQSEKHSDLEHTQLEPLFDCVLTDSGTALGVRFSEASEEEQFLQHVNRMIKEMAEEKILAAAAASTTISDNNNNNNSNNNNNGATDSLNRSTSSSSSRSDSNTLATAGGSPSTTTTTTTSSSSQFLYCLNYMNNQKDESVRRGAIVKSLAICTTHPFIHIYKPFMILGIQKYYSSPSLEVIIELYNSLNSLDMSTVPFLNDVQKHILRSSPDKNKQSHSTNITYLGKPMPVYIPITLFPDEVGDYKVITLVQKFGNDVMKIFNDRQGSDESVVGHRDTRQVCAVRQRLYGGSQLQHIGALRRGQDQESLPGVHPAHRGYGARRGGQSIKKLRKRKHVAEKEVLKIYDSFLNSIKTEQQVTEFLSYLPKSHGGLFPVAVGLFHQSKDVRNATCELLKRLDKIQTGSGFISGLNPFLKQCYERNLKYQ